MDPNSNFACYDQQESGDLSQRNVEDRERLGRKISPPLLYWFLGELHQTEVNLLLVKRCNYSIKHLCCFPCDPSLFPNRHGAHFVSVAVFTHTEEKRKWDLITFPTFSSPSFFQTLPHKKCFGTALDPSKSMTVRGLFCCPNATSKEVFNFISFQWIFNFP